MAPPPFDPCGAVARREAASASSTVRVNSCSSLSRLRRSILVGCTGPYRPLRATMSTPSGSGPTVRGRASSCSAVSIESSSMSHVLEKGRSLRLRLAALLGLAELDVWPETAGLPVHGEPGLGVGPEDLVAGVLVLDQLRGLLDRQLVGGQVIGDRGPLLADLHIRAIASDPGHDLVAGLVDTDRYRARLLLDRSHRGGSRPCA